MLLLLLDPRQFTDLLLRSPGRHAVTVVDLTPDMANDEPHVFPRWKSRFPAMKLSPRLTAVPTDSWPPSPRVEPLP